MRLKEKILLKILDENIINNLITKNVQKNNVLRGIYGKRTKVGASYYRNLLFAIVNKRANALSNLEYTIIDKNGEPVNKNHWAYNLLYYNVNEYQNFNELIKAISYSLDYTGNAFLGVLDNREGIKLYLLPTNSIKVDLNSNGEKVYIFKEGFEEVKFNIDDIIHINDLNVKYNELKNLISGEPNLLNASKDLVETEKEILEFINRYFERDTIPPMVLKTEAQLSDEEWLQYKARWNEAIKDYPILGVIEGGGDITSVINENKQVSTIKDIDDIIINRLCSIWGVPPALITSKYQNRDTAYLQLNDFYTNTVKPIANNIIGSLNRYLSRYDIEIEIGEYDYADKRSNLDFNLLLFQNGVISKEEFREILGLGISEKPINENENEKIKNLKSNFVIDKNKFYNEWLKKLNSDEDKLTKAFGKAIDKIARYVNERALEYTKELSKMVMKDDDNVIYNLLDIFSEDELEKIIIEETGEPMEKMGKSAIEKAAKDTEYNINQNEINELAKKVIEANFGKIKYSSKTLSKEMGEILKRIIESNAYFNINDIISKFTKEVGDHLKNIKYSRVKAIVRTVTTGINATAQVETWQKQGLSMSWLSSRDSSVRDDHQNADGQVRFSLTPVGYLVGGEEMTAPAMGILPENNVNCRCLNLPIMKG